MSTDSPTAFDSAALKPDRGIRTISDAQQRRIRRFPCDGVRRYTVGRWQNLTYDEAYDAILKIGTAKHDGEGKPVLSHAGITRLARLNDLYLSAAGDFVTQALGTIAIAREIHTGNVELEKKIEAAQKANADAKSETPNA